MWARVRDDLDAYAESWATTLSEVCRSQRRSRFDDVRLSCLHRQKRRFDALVAGLARVRPEAIDDAGMAESSLARPRECLTADVTEQRVAATDPRAEPIEELLAEANALTRAYRFDQAGELANSALVRAEALGHRGLVAEAELQIGVIASMADRNEASMEHLERAYFLADEIGAHGFAATAASKLVFALSEAEGSVEQTERWHAYAKAHLDALDGGGPKATVLLSLGTMWLRRGEYAKAVDVSMEAATTFEAEYGPTHSGVAGALSNAGYAYSEMGQADEALEVLERASNIYEDVLGPRHPAHALVLLNQGLALYRSARFSDALVGLERAIEIFEGQSQVPFGMLARAEMNRGLCLLELRRIDESLTGMNRARDLYLDSYGPSHSELALVDMNLGLIHHTQSHYDDALVAYERAWAAQVEQLGAEHPRAAMTEHNIGVTLNAAGRYDEAATRLRSALRVFEAKIGPRTDLVAAASMELGHALDGLGESATGLALIATSIEILESPQSDNDRFLVNAMVYHAQALGSLGRHDEAQRELQRALERAEVLSDPDPSLMFDLRHESGVVASALGDRNEARDSFRMAVDIARSEPFLAAKVDMAEASLARLRP
jgi:tetratricopeptide (TPR) repeat protein